MIVCDRIYQEKISGASVERPELGKLLELIREGDTLVIWKLDRLGRSLVHLVQLVTDLEQRQVGLLSLNDPVDTTTAQGRLVFRIFASLAEFEREVIRERTLAGLASARRRGKLLGRPKGSSKAAEQKARIAESLYKEEKYSVEQIARELTMKLFKLIFRLKIETDRAVVPTVPVGRNMNWIHTRPGRSALHSDTHRIGIQYGKFKQLQ